VRSSIGIFTAGMAALVAVGPGDAARADEVAAFYKGRTISIFVGFAAGGGADLWARFIARHLGKHVPGEPSVVVQNLPGAGGFAAVNHVFVNAAQDGTALLLPTSTAIAAPVMGIPNVRWETFKFHWLGNLTRDVSGCATSGKSGIKSAAEGATRQIVYGADGMDDPASHHPRMLNNLLGYKNKIIAGYKGTGPALVAVESGELDARCSVWASMALSNKKDDFETGKLVPILQVATVKHPVFGNAPLILDLARTEEQRKIMSFIVGPLEISRPLAAAPGTPPARVAALREALWKAAHSEEMLAEAKRFQFLIAPMNASDTERALRDAIDVSPDIVAKSKAAIEN
jgi:tripartite-type tricarboxylate transporter receptor subunit TctC